MSAGCKASAVCKGKPTLDSVPYTCWTDSTIALSWVKGDPKKWKQFVSNRFREIQDLPDPASWNHCPGRENPADLVTRGVSAEALLKSDLWLHGPRWLHEVELAGPDDVERACADESPLGEIWESAETELVVLSTTSIEVAKPCIEFDRWSSFPKVLRIVAWMKRFILIARSRDDKLSGDLSFEEVSRAKTVVLKCVQKQAYAHEFECLNCGKPVPKAPPLLLIRHQDLLMKHAGVAYMLTSLRSNYWIVGLRRLAKTVKRGCFACQRQDSQPCGEPAAPLPKLGVSEALPFTVMGVDFAGPLLCADTHGKKLYICLFTCAVTRAVHLELTESLATSDFMLALRRFASRRRLSSVLYSDNANTFKGASIQLQSYFGHLAPEWKWIAPRSPWWERLVRSVKSALRKSLGSKCLTRCELETTLPEVESCINSRLLCAVGDEIDYANPLTSSHFLTGTVSGFEAKVLEDHDAISTKILSERERSRLRRMESFLSSLHGGRNT